MEICFESLFSLSEQKTLPLQGEINYAAMSKLLDIKYYPNLWFPSWTFVWLSKNCTIRFRDLELLKGIISNQIENIPSL